MYLLLFTVRIFFFRFGYFVLEQPGGKIDYFKSGGGPTNGCGPDMAEGRGPFRYRTQDNECPHKELLTS